MGIHQRGVGGVEEGSAIFRRFGSFISLPWIRRRNALLQNKYHRSGLRSDVLNVSNELLKRIDPKVAATVLRVPSVVNAETGASVSTAGMIPSKIAWPSFHLGDGTEVDNRCSTG